MLIVRFWTRCIALKDDYQKKRLELLVYNLVEQNDLETLTKTLIIPAGQNQFIEEIDFHNATVCQIGIAKNTNSAFS